ncbi:P-loop containing nucleoside triphosphate hydrolase [Pseudocohnilembus persalinus]|uniref:p-loop containing nucleoside triphosphate hydrolase n=1 Tax=Pseudocohnilembus persalinus TaxID=266149 RepID=A0A0V0R2A4_PSEPJ|nr:P-loop containing nucleoside triphosphate hydrolase [Pseudocohnilembus persalinus]|eukprot:KRX08659.1 P-loop containing nucleoside triphosphate hydrolase [Pseudocohnilembus persalinus]
MEDNKKQYSIKVVMLGDTEVGKTSIIQRFVKNDFKSYFQSTQGVHFEEKKIILENGVHIDYKVWDTAGQERFKSINSLYYKDARIAVLVYDITNEQSFETLKFWLKEVKEHGKKNCILAIVGNKSDLDNDQVNASEAQHLARVIPKQQFILKTKHKNFPKFLQRKMMHYSD